MRAISALAAEMPPKPNRAATRDTSNMTRAHFNSVDIGSILPQFRWRHNPRGRDRFRAHALASTAYVAYPTNKHCCIRARMTADIDAIADEVLATLGTGRQITPFTSRPGG